ncbi:MAG: inorganic triphosphatase [Acidaminococcaceae bacterium]
MDNTTEMEIKLSVSKESLKKLLDSSLLKAAMVPDSLQEKELENYYYDTASYKLFHEGIAYRIRKSEDGYVATIKTDDASQGGFSERKEYNVPIKEATPTLEGFAELGLTNNLEKLLVKENLQILFKVLVKRQIRLLQITSDTLIEMAIDKGNIIAGGKKEKIEEVEFEIVKGNKSDLFEFVAALAVEIPLFIEPRSKFKRGIDLLADDVDHADVEEKGVKIDRNGNAEVQFKKLIYYDIAVILEAQNALRDATALEDADRILLNRAKRLRAVINFIKPLIELHDYDDYHKMLAEIIDPLQQLYVLKRFMRQWDKVYKKTGTILKNNVLTERLRERRLEIMQTIKEQIESGLYARGMFRMLAWIEISHWQGTEFVQMEQFSLCRFRDWHKKLLAFKFTNEMLEEENAREMRKIIEVMVLVRRSIKIGALDKQTFAYMKDLYRKLKILNFDIYGHKDILAFLQGSNSRVLYRDAGLLIGWRLSEMPGAWREVQKSWAQLLAALKSKGKE